MEKSITVAICDDEKAIRDEISECIRNITTAAVVKCFDNASGILNDDFDADILFLDIQMPGIDGMEAARKLRASGKGTVIIFVTALEEYVFKAFDVGAFQYIVKPFESEKLIEIATRAIKSVRAHINNMASQLKQGTLSYNDYTKMALSESLIDKCAANSFSDEQRQVIVRAMKDYNERLINRNNETISKSDYVKNDDESAGRYWGLKKVIPAAARDEMAKLFGNSPSGTIAVTSIATNRELIESLQKKAKEIDVTTLEGFEQFKAFYRTTMSSVYEAQYPDKMRSNSGAAIELDLNGSDGMKKLVEFANRWLEGKVQ